MQNVVVSVFKVESEGYQATTELKQNPGTDASFVVEGALVKKEAGSYKVLDSFDTGVYTSDDTMFGSVIGMCIGVLGGPIGVLLGGSIGALAGLSIDAEEAGTSASMIEQIIGKLDDDMVALIALVNEDNESILDSKLSKYETTIARFDAAVVAQEVEKANELQKEMERQAKAELRRQNKEEHKAKVDAKRNQMKASFENFKAKHSKKEVEQA